MGEIEFVREYLKRVHTSLDEAISGLTQEQAHWLPNDKSNHIAFVAWHYARTVDNLVRFVLQKQPTVWMAGKWDQHFGLDSRAQGTGMSREQAQALQLRDIPAFCTYMGQVWEEAQRYLGSLSEADLAQKVTVRPLGELTVKEVLGTPILTHGYMHLGEIWLLRGLQGLRGSPV